MSFELPFAHSLLLCCRQLPDGSARSRKAPSVTLLDGDARCCGAALPLYAARPLDAGTVTVVDCVAVGGCRLDIAGAVDALAVPLASNALELLVARVRVARSLAATGQGVAPRVLLVGSGEGATAWAAATLATSPSAFAVPPPPPPSGGGGGGGGGGTAAGACAVLDFSLRPTPTSPGGSVALRFVASRGVCLETYNFFVGAASLSHVAAAAAAAAPVGVDASSSDTATTLVDTILDVAAVAHDMIAAVAAANLQFSPCGMVVDVGDLDAATAAQLVPKLLRQLRISHVGILLGGTPAAAALRESVVGAVSAVVRGVSIDTVRVSWPAPAALWAHSWMPSSGGRVHEDGAAAAGVVGTAVLRYLRGDSSAASPLTPVRLVLDVANVELVDAQTLRPLAVRDLRPLSLCAVAAPLPRTQAQSAPAGAAGGRAKRRLVAGFVVLVEIGVSSIVVVAPAAGALPSRTLMVSADVRVPRSCVPSVLATA